MSNQEKDLKVKAKRNPTLKINDDVVVVLENGKVLLGSIVESSVKMTQEGEKKEYFLSALNQPEAIWVVNPSSINKATATGMKEALVELCNHKTQLEMQLPE